MSSPHPLTARGAYTEAQLTRYLSHIGLPSPDTFISSCRSSPLTSLTTLLRYQLSEVSFDSLVLHYTPYHTVVLSEEALFEKVVGAGEKGLGKRGGYCMENNTFFAAVLRGLGYEVLTTGARVSNAANGIFDGGFTGWSHEALLVKIEGKRHLVDVGFGPQGPIRPLPLEEGVETPGIAPGSLRLIKDNIAPNTDPDQRLWIYQSREKPDGPWLTNYCFTELEFLPTDFEVMSFRTSTSRTSWFTYRLVCVKMVLSEDKEEIIGTITLMGNTLKRRIGGVTEQLGTFGSEGERVEALEKWFGIKLTEEERGGIRGMVSKLAD